MMVSFQFAIDDNANNPICSICFDSYFHAHDINSFDTFGNRLRTELYSFWLNSLWNSIPLINLFFSYEFSECRLLAEHKLNKVFLD